MPISELEEMLQPYGFLRIHRSFIVAVDKIRAYSATEVEVGGKMLPIGRSYKELVGQHMAGL
jgi:DNA-binding LytR/AlgR family response regulator